MADKIVVTKSKVTALFTSIRNKLGISGQKTFDEMKSAVDAYTPSDGDTITKDVWCIPITGSDFETTHVFPSIGDVCSIGGIKYEINSKLSSGVYALADLRTYEISITSNGSYNVSSYGTANVNIPQPTTTYYVVGYSSGSSLYSSTSRSECTSWISANGYATRWSSGNVIAVYTP